MDCSNKCKTNKHCCKNSLIMLNDMEYNLIKEQVGDFDVTKFESFYYIKPPCLFLDEKNNCRIYGVRPLNCRKYPFILDIENVNNNKVFVYLSPACKNLESITSQDSNDMLKAELRITAFQFKHLKNRKLKTINKERLFMKKFINLKLKTEKPVIAKPYSSIHLFLIKKRIDFNLKNNLFTFKDVIL